MVETKPTNEQIATVLEHIGDLLETLGENRFRVQAYFNGAQSVRQAQESVAEMVRQDQMQKLEELPDIGSGLAGVIEEYVQTGRSSLLDDLRGQVSPGDLFRQIPGIGDDLAQKVVDELDVNSLEELEQAAHDGRLEQVEGFGPRRVEAVRAALAGYLSGAALRHRQRVAAEAEGEAAPRGDRPSVATLLDVDAEYRRKAQANELRTITPKRFNPENRDWLPILNTDRQGRSFTALYSNTAQAHELDKTHDWVVIYFDRDGREDQVTVVTAGQGPLKGKRVVRGREAETRKYYEERGELET